MNAHIAADRMHSMPLCHIDFMLINDNLMRTLCAPSTASPFRTNNRHFENSRSTEYNEPRRRRRWMRSAQKKQTNKRNAAQHNLQPYQPVFKSWLCNQFVVCTVFERRTQVTAKCTSNSQFLYYIFHRFCSHFLFVISLRKFDISEMLRLPWPPPPPPLPFALFAHSISFLDLSFVFVFFSLNKFNALFIDF